MGSVSNWNKILVCHFIIHKPKFSNFLIRKKEFNKALMYFQMGTQCTKPAHFPLAFENLKL